MKNLYFVPKKETISYKLDFETQIFECPTFCLKIPNVAIVAPQCFRVPKKFHNKTDLLLLFIFLFTTHKKSVEGKRKYTSIIIYWINCYYFFKNGKCLLIEIILLLVKRLKHSQYLELIRVIMLNSCLCSVPFGVPM